MRKMKNARINRIFNTFEIIGGRTPRTKRFLKGALARNIAKIGRLFSYTSLKSYGVFMLSFGLATLLLNLTKYYVLENPVIAPSSLIVGAVFAFIGIPLIFCDKPTCIALEDFWISDYILFEFFSIKRMNRIKNPPEIPLFFSIFLGAVPAAIGFLFPLKYVLFTFLALLITALSFTSPEFPVMLTLVCLPYLGFFEYGEYLLAIISLLSFLGYFLRVLIGKRAYHLDFYGLAILLFGVIFTVGGVIGFGAESQRNAWIYLAVLLGYYPVSGLVVNRRLTDTAIKAIVFSTLPISLYTLTEHAIIFIKNGFSLDAFYGALGNEKGFLLCAYLIISAVFTLMFFFEKSNPVKRAFYITFFLVDVLALLSLFTCGALVALFGALLLAFLSFKNAKIGYIMLPLVLLPYLIPLLPSAYLDAASSFLKLSPTVSEIKALLSENLGVGLSNILFGVGIGKDSYGAYLGTDGIRADNLFIGILSSVGVFALSVLLVILAIKFIQSSAFSSYAKYSSVYVAANMSNAALCALLLLGAFGNVFEYVELFYMFFVIFGIASATLRIAKKETDDRLNYYGDARSSETSSIDVNIA